jgi:hypothetical protein
MVALTKTASLTGSLRFLQRRYSVINPNRQETATTARDRLSSQDGFGFLLLGTHLACLEVSSARRSAKSVKGRLHAYFSQI